MIESFAGSGTEDLFNGRRTKAARRLCPARLWRVAERKLDQLDSVEKLSELRIPPGSHLERLGGDRRGQHSIRVNELYRVCFRWSKSGPRDVEIVDYH